MAGVLALGAFPALAALPAPTAFSDPAALPAPAMGSLTALAQRRVPPTDVRGHGVSEELVRLVREAAAAMPPFPALPPDSLGAEAARPVLVHIAGSERELARLAGGRLPEWGAGIAIPSQRTVVLPALGRRNRDPAALLGTLRHELAHIALHDALAPNRVPRWFDEGYARWSAGEWDASAEWRLRFAFAMNRAPPLDSLTLGWPRRAAEAEVAYLLAASAVGYLLEQGGEPGLARFLARWRATGSMDVAMRRTYGRSAAQLEHDWQRVVRSRYGWAAALSHATVFWAFAAVLLVVLWMLRRRRNAARRAALTDPPDRPAFWLGEDATDGSDPDPHPPDPDPTAR